MFLCGSFDLSVDAKNRLTIPAAVRDEVGKYLYVLPGDRVDVLAIYPQAQYEQMRRSMPPTNRLSREAREFRRFEAAMTARLEVDTAGRVLLPDKLLQFSSLTRDVTLVCAEDHLELWSRRQSDEFIERVKADAYEERRERALREFYGGADDNGAVSG